MGVVDVVVDKDVEVAPERVAPIANRERTHGARARAAPADGRFVPCVPGLVQELIYSYVHGRETTPYAIRFVSLPSSSSPPPPPQCPPDYELIDVNQRVIALTRAVGWLWNALQIHEPKHPVKGYVCHWPKRFFKYLLQNNYDCLLSKRRNQTIQNFDRCK